ncbi:MAG: IS66 family transposase [Terriglobia bacterium]
METSKSSPDQYKDLDREDLIALLIERDKVNADLLRRIKELEDHLGLGGGGSSPSIKNTRAAKPGVAKKDRKRRTQPFTRKREAPTRTVDHHAENCPDCGRHLPGGTPGRSRQIIDFVPSPVEVVEHVIYDSWCGVCKKRVRAQVDFSAWVSGKRRIGHYLASWIAYLHVNARVPLRTVQRMLRQMYSVHVSLGEMCALMAEIARKGTSVIAGIKKEVQTGSVLHADETGWKLNGEYRCLWSLSNALARWFHIDPHRSSDVALRLIGETFSGTLVTDFYAVYNKMPGRHQRCWPHLARDLDKLRLHPLYDKEIGDWIDSILQLWHEGRKYRAYCLARPLFGASVFDRRRKRKELESELTKIVQPYWEVDSAQVPQATLAKRMGIFMNELFTFVEYPEVPDDNNAAERAIRPAVILRKVCGGTRSEHGTEVKAALLTLFETWKLRRDDPILQCKAILAST